MYLIEKGIKMPAIKGDKYPFARMDVGDSFFFDANPENVKSAMRTYAKKSNTKFFVARVPGDYLAGSNLHSIRVGFRCWRVR
jgi:hypothetical protein